MRWLPLLFSLAPAITWAGEVVDTILVTANEEPVTRSHLAFMGAYLKVTGGERMGRPVSTHPDEATLRRILEEDALLYGMAARLGALEPSPAEVLVMEAWFRAKFFDEGAWSTFVQHWGFDELARREFFTRRLRIEKFIALKVGGAEVPTEGELREFYNDQSNTWDQRPFEEVRGEVVALWRTTRQQERFSVWMESYQKNHRDALQQPAQFP